MADTSCATTILSVPNGLSAPLYAEGQVVRAADLTLDRGAHDAELWRLRRYLHGWGVVAGLVAELQEGGSLFVNRGYGICPSGEEVLLPDDIAIHDLAQKIRAACGPGAAGCGLDAAQPAATGAVQPLTVWLVIRPRTTPADPRPALPAGCGHPGNTLSPARLCGGVVLDLCCALPGGHAPRAVDYDTLRPILCENRPVFMPEDLPEPGLLVLAAITLTGTALEIDTRLRRPLLPVSLLQDFVIACCCQMSRPDPVVEPVPEPVRPVPTPGPVPGRPGQQTEANTGVLVGTPVPDRLMLERDLQLLLQLAEQKKVQLTPEPVVGPVSPIPDPVSPVIRTEAIARVVQAGVTPVEILNTDIQTLAVKTGLDTQAVSALQKDLSLVAGRASSVRF